MRNRIKCAEQIKDCTSRVVLSADLGREGRGRDRSPCEGGDVPSVTKFTTRAAGMSRNAEGPLMSQGDASMGEPQARCALLAALEAALLPVRGRTQGLKLVSNNASKVKSLLQRRKSQLNDEI